MLITADDQMSSFRAMLHVLFHEPTTVESKFKRRAKLIILWDVPQVPLAEWSAEDLKGQDMEYVEWSGEYQLALRLNERLFTLKSIENVT